MLILILLLYMGRKQTKKNFNKRSTRKIKKIHYFSKNDFGSGDGMLTSVWGPSLWHTLHTVSFNYPVKPTIKDKINYRRFVLELKYVLPCKYCRDNLKKNLKTYLNQYRMLGDTISLKDAYVLNIAIDFEIITLPDYNNNQVLFTCISELKNKFNIGNWGINQPIILRELFTLLDNVDGVQTVKKVLVSNKRGTSQGYSQYAYDINGATLNGVIYPSLDPSIFEVKYPDLDITGKVVTL